MTGNQFGFHPEELLRIQRDFEQINQRMAEMTKQVGNIRSTVAKAAGTDVFSAQILGFLGAAAVLTQVTKDVADISDRADALMKAKEELTKGLGEDAAKIKQIIDRYARTDRGVAGEMNKPKGNGTTQPGSPGTRIDGGADKGGHKGGGDGGGNGGSHHPQPAPPNDHGGGDTGSGTPAGGPGGKFDGPKLKDRSTGDWKTHYRPGYSTWDGWSDHRHKRNGEGLGVKARPKLDGLSPERKAIVERALERAEHKLGYSQSAITNGYRVDCSGLVSCAWGLPGPGLDTHGLMASSVSKHIGKGDLQPGDAMISGEHTILFAGWADAAHTRYIGIEDSGDAGMVSREIPYPYFHGGSAYQPYRRNGVE